MGSSLLLSSCESIAIIGTEASIIQVEVHLGTGLPCFAIVGLPAKSVREAEHRTRAAMESAGASWPKGRKVANLAPGALRKEGTHFDLSIALAVLQADKQIPEGPMEGWVAMGELGLDGSIRPVRGILAAAITCRKAGRRGIICPAANAREAAIIDDIEVVPVTSLAECIGFVKGEWAPDSIPDDVHLEPQMPSEDMSEVRGHPTARRAAEVAAAGAHNLLLGGPPGSGKTMLARRMPGILPAMSLEESLEVTRVHSVAGLLGERASLVTRRPFRVPHHHVSLAGLIGGGSGLARPGEVSLAHHGVLFLDELPLYTRSVLESLRGPVEDGVVRIARSGGVLTYPCRFSLVAAMNPCPCGYLGDVGRSCRCSEMQISNYTGRLSGPLLDRFDLQVTMHRATRTELLGAPEGECSAVIAARVEQARAAQLDRYDSPLLTNASVPKSLLDRTMHLTSESLRTLGYAIDALGLSGRGVNRVLRVSRTIADIAGSTAVTEDHLVEAISLRAGAAEEVRV